MTAKDGKATEDAAPIHKRLNQVASMAAFVATDTQASKLVHHGDKVNWHANKFVS